MGKDKRNAERLNCEKCSCKEYEPPIIGHDCDFCGCKPTNHICALGDRNQSTLETHEQGTGGDSSHDDSEMTLSAGLIEGEPQQHPSLSMALNYNVALQQLFTEKIKKLKSDLRSNQSRQIQLCGRSSSNCRYGGNGSRKRSMDTNLSRDDFEQNQINTSALDWKREDKTAYSSHHYDKCCMHLPSQRKQKYIFDRNYRNKFGNSSLDDDDQSHTYERDDMNEYSKTHRLNFQCDTNPVIRTDPRLDPRRYQRKDTHEKYSNKRNVHIGQINTSTPVDLSPSTHTSGIASYMCHNDLTLIPMQIDGNNDIVCHSSDPNMRETTNESVGQPQDFQSLASSLGIPSKNREPKVMPQKVLRLHNQDSMCDFILISDTKNNVSPPGPPQPPLIQSQVNVPDVSNYAYSCLLMTGLPLFANSRYIYYFFKEFLLLDIAIEVDYKYQCNGNAYILFCDHLVAKKAFKSLNGWLMNGHQIILEPFTRVSFSQVKNIYKSKNIYREANLGLPEMPRGNANPYFKKRTQKSPSLTNTQEFAVASSSGIAQDDDNFIKHHAEYKKTLTKNIVKNKSSSKNLKELRIKKNDEIENDEKIQKTTLQGDSDGNRDHRTVDDESKIKDNCKLGSKVETFLYDNSMPKQKKNKGKFKRSHFIILKTDRQNVITNEKQKSYKESIEVINIKQSYSMKNKNVMKENSRENKSSLDNELVDTVENKCHFTDEKENNKILNKRFSNKHSKVQKIKQNSSPAKKKSFIMKKKALPTKSNMKSEKKILKINKRSASAVPEVFNADETSKLDKIHFMELEDHTVIKDKSAVEVKEYKSENISDNTNYSTPYEKCVTGINISDIVKKEVFNIENKKAESNKICNKKKRILPHLKRLNEININKTESIDEISHHGNTKEISEGNIKRDTRLFLESKNIELGRNLTDQTENTSISDSDQTIVFFESEIDNGNNCLFLERSENVYGKNLNESTLCGSGEVLKFPLTSRDTEINDFNSPAQYKKIETHVLYLQNENNESIILESNDTHFGIRYDEGNSDIFENEGSAEEVEKKKLPTFSKTQETVAIRSREELAVYSMNNHRNISRENDDTADKKNNLSKKKKYQKRKCTPSRKLKVQLGNPISYIRSNVNLSSKSCEIMKNPNTIDLPHDNKSTSYHINKKEYSDKEEISETSATLPHRRSSSRCSIQKSTVNSDLSYSTTPKIKITIDKSNLNGSIKEEFNSDESPIETDKIYDMEPITLSSDEEDINKGNVNAHIKEEVNSYISPSDSVVCELNDMEPISYSSDEASVFGLPICLVQSINEKKLMENQTYNKRKGIFETKKEPENN